MCLMRRKEVDLLFRVSHALHKQIKTDISPLTIKNIINHPGRSWVDATAKYIIVSWNRSRPLAFTESHFIYYSWLNSPVVKVKGFSYIMNGYLNGQVCGPILPVEFRCWSCKKKVFWSYNRSFINQASSFKMAGYWPHSFFFFLHFHWPHWSWSIKEKKRKKELCQYPGVLTYMWCLVSES